MAFLEIFGFFLELRAQLVVDSCLVYHGTAGRTDYVSRGVRAVLCLVNDEPTKNA